MRAWLAYAIVVLVWGSTYLVVLYGLESFTPPGLVSVRFACAGAIALLIGRARRESLPTRRECAHLALVGALLLGACNMLVVWSEDEGRLSSGMAAVLCALVPLWLCLQSMRSEPLGRRAWVCVGLGFAGVVLLMRPWREFGGELEGGLAIVLSTAIWAWGTLHAKRYVRGGGTLTNAGLQMLAGALVASAVAGLGTGWRSGELTPRALYGLAYLVLFGSVLAFSAYGYLARAWPAARMGTYAYLNPLVAVALGCWLAGERFDLELALGIALILLPVALLQRTRAPLVLSAASEPLPPALAEPEPASSGARAS
jgi:drug/metabolite transporter (DMT)-like permease